MDRKTTSRSRQTERKALCYRVFLTGVIKIDLFILSGFACRAFRSQCKDNCFSKAVAKPAICNGKKFI